MLNINLFWKAWLKGGTKKGVKANSINNSTFLVQDNFVQLDAILQRAAIYKQILSINSGEQGIYKYSVFSKPTCIVSWITKYKFLVFALV